MKMPKELKDKWVAALRSGEYKQGKSALCNTLSGGYCCLGVLEMVADGKVEVETDGRYEGQPATMPTNTWYEAHGIKVYEEHAKITPGMLADFNDDGTPFSEIANFIEEQVEVTDDTNGGL